MIASVPLEDQDMAEPKDAILPMLRKLREDITEIRKEQQAAKVRDIDLTDAVHEIKDELTVTHTDSLLHLGRATRHRLDFEAPRDSVEDLTARVAALESRS
jgi:phage I-like protein